MEDLRDDPYTKQSRKTHLNRVETLRLALGPWGQELHPISVAETTYAAAALHSGGYMSAAAYLSAYEVAAERRGDPVTT